MKGIRILGTGHYLPQQTVTNDDMAKLVETSDEWISSRTGIRTRHFAKGETVTYMAQRAAEQALAAAGCAAEEIGMIVCSTITPEMDTPSVACLLQGKLGAKNAFCMDISCACSGFVHALDIAQKYLTLGEVRRALVLSAETLSHVTDFSDRMTCVLFGDGAGACVVEAAEGRYGALLGADGTGAGALYIGRRYFPTAFETKEDRAPFKSFDYVEDGAVHMDGKEVYKFSTAALSLAVQGACGKIGVSPEEIGLIIPHQANIRIIQTGMKHLGLPLEKAYVNINRAANTSSATIPIALDEAVREGRIHRGDVVAVVGFGAGLTYGAAVFDWN